MPPLPTFSTLGHGPTVLMLHGVGGGHLAFAPQVEALAGWGYRAVAWDMPGYGHSAPVEPYHFKNLALRCIALIEALMQPQGGGPVALVGHSMGGMVAQEVVARRPDLVSRLVLCATSAAFGHTPGSAASHEWQQRFIQARLAPLEAGQSMAELAEQLIPTMVGPRADPAGVELAKRCLAGISPVTYRRADLSRIAVPTLVVAGEADASTSPAVMRQMADQIVGSEWAVMPGIGHLMNLEAPDAFSEALRRFLRRTDRAPTVH